MSLYKHFGYSCCGGPFNGGNCPGCTSVGSRNEFVYDPNPYSYNDTPNFFNQPRHHQYETYSCELCGDSPHYVFYFQIRTPLVYEQKPCYNQNFIDNYYPQNSSSFPQQYLCCENCGEPHGSFQCQPRNQNYLELNPCYDPNSFGFDKFQPSQSVIDHLKIHEDLQQRMNDSMIELYETFQAWLQQQVVNLDSYTPEPSQCRRLPFSTMMMMTMTRKDPKDSLIIGDEHLDTIPEKESNEFIKSSVENLVSNPSEPENTSGSDSKFILPSCDDFSPINVFEEKSNIESNDSYDSNLDEPDLLVTPLSDANEDECFDPGGDIDEIDVFLDADVSTDIEDGYHDLEGDIIYLKSLLLNDTILNLRLKVFSDHDPKSFKDELDNCNFKSMVKVIDPGIHVKTFLQHM
nr:hypothetical protein [Tanacetum cinerariifolium]